VADLAVIIVSFNSREWLTPCLESLDAQAGDAELEIVVVDNDSTDGSADLVEQEFPHVRVLRRENRGFAYGNNRGLLAVDAPFVLFLNADAELAEGTLGELLDHMRARPEIGLVGCRQLTPDGVVYPTIRRFPSATRFLFEALGSEQLPFRAPWLGSRELDMAAYDRDVSCDWVSGSFMLARREAVLSAGLMDERFFLYCEEPDLCLRIKQTGWEVRHSPIVTIFHPWGRAGFNPRLVAQEAYAYRQYMQKHFSAPRRAVGIFALALGHALRGLAGSRDPELRRDRRKASRVALRTLLGLAPAPFGPPPVQAVAIESTTDRVEL
jgi:GT2 family glycosyltransferase